MNDFYPSNWWPTLNKWAESLLGIVFPDNWDAAVRVNICTSIAVAFCCTTFLIMGHIRRGKLNMILDFERWGITGFLLGIIAFFVGRAIQIGEAGRTVADPWFLTIGVLTAVLAFIANIAVILNWDHYNIVPHKKWKDGDPERRVAERRRVTE